MHIGIIGAGGIGQAIAGHLAKAGYEVVLSNSRDPQSLAKVVRDLGPRARAVPREEAAKADIVFLAVRWPQVTDALSGLPDWNERILIDATNPVAGADSRTVDPHGRTSSEIVAGLAPGARVVKACNTLLRAVLAADPHEGGGRRVLFMSGDDLPAKTTAKAVLERAGFATIDLGDLISGGKLQQFPGGPLPTLNLIKLG